MGGWKHTIDIFIAKCSFEFLKIIDISGYNKLRLSSIAIWRMAIPTIGQLVEFGMKFYTSSSNEYVRKIFKWPYKVARFALGQRSSIPKRYLE